MGCPETTSLPSMGCPETTSLPSKGFPETMSLPCKGKRAVTLDVRPLSFSTTSLSSMECLGTTSLPSKGLGTTSLPSNGCPETTSAPSMGFPETMSLPCKGKRAVTLDVGPFSFSTPIHLGNPKYCKSVADEAPRQMLMCCQALASCLCFMQAISEGGLISHV